MSEICLWMQSDAPDKYVQKCSENVHDDRDVVMHFWALKNFKFCPYCGKAIQIQDMKNVIKISAFNGVEND